jgi:hypothetical protein
MMLYITCAFLKVSSTHNISTDFFLFSVVLAVCFPSCFAARSFFWQVPGAMTPWLVALLLCLTDLSSNSKWRIILGMGGFPAVLVVVLVYYELGLEAEKKHQKRKDSFNAMHIQKGPYCN